MRLTHTYRVTKRLNQTTQTVLSGISGGQFTADISAAQGEAPAPADEYRLGAVGNPQVDRLLSADDLAAFGEDAVRAQHDTYANSGGERRRLASERCSLIRTKRLAVLALDEHPGAKFVDISCDNEDSTGSVERVVYPDGSHVSDPNWVGIFEPLDDEAFDIYGSNEAWQALTAEDCSDNLHRIDLQRAAAITADDIEQTLIN